MSAALLWRPAALLVLTSLVLSVSGQAAHTCHIDRGDSTPPCLLDIGSGHIDLRPLDNHIKAAPVFNNIPGNSSGDGITVWFSYNPCRPFTKAPEHNYTKIYECTDVLLCEELKDASTNKTVIDYYNLGDTSYDVHCAVDDSGVHIVYNITVGGLARTTRVYVMCNESIERQFLPLTTGITNDTKDFKFELHSKYGCVVTPAPPPPDKGMSTGSILLLVAFVGISAYLLLGMLGRYFCVGARGVEVIPHLQFWKDVPILIVGGMLFAKDIICCNSSKPNYDDI